MLEHVAHVGDLRDIPTVDVLVEARRHKTVHVSFTGCVRLDTRQVGDGADVPLRDVAVGRLRARRVAAPRGQGGLQAVLVGKGARRRQRR